MKTCLLNSQGKYTQNRVLIISTYSGKGKLKKNCTKAKRLFSFCFNTAIRMIAPTDNVPAITLVVIQQGKPICKS